MSTLLVSVTVTLTNGETVVMALFDDGGDMLLVDLGDGKTARLRLDLIDSPPPVVDPNQLSVLDG